MKTRTKTKAPILTFSIDEEGHIVTDRGRLDELGHDTLRKLQIQLVSALVAVDEVATDRLWAEGSGKPFLVDLPRRDFAALLASGEKESDDHEVVIATIARALQGGREFLLYEVQVDDDHGLVTGLLEDLQQRQDMNEGRCDDDSGY